jgi:DNA-binding NarL/FixJ family response regulator
MPDTTVCGECSDGRNAIEQAEKLRPDIVIADPWLPRANGVIVTKRILRDNPATKVLIFGFVDSRVIIREFLQAGAKALLFKTDPVSDLVDAIQALQRDQLYFTPTIQAVILDEYLNDHCSDQVASTFAKQLSLREREVMQLLCEGKQSKEIADELDISFRTAATHRTNLMRKLGVHSVVELTLHAISHQQLEVPGSEQYAEVLEMPKPLRSNAQAAA